MPLYGGVWQSLSTPIHFSRLMPTHRHIHHVGAGPMLVIPLGSPILTSRRLALGTAAVSEQPASRKRTLGVATLLALIALLSAITIWIWLYPAFLADDPQALPKLQSVALTAGVLAFTVTMGLALRPQWSPAIAPLIAIFGGLFGGGLALGAELRFPGIAIQSVVVTFSVFAVLLVGYLTGLLKVTTRVRAVAMTALAGVALVYLLGFVLGLFGLQIPLISGVGWGPLLWSAFVALTAAVNLLVDIDLIDSIDRRRLPRYMEWYIAAGTVITFIWLYVTILRLLQRAQVMR